MKREMTCPRCGAPMNHQADKLVEPTTRAEAEASGVLGGVLVAVFACPNCGFIASRRDEPEER
jgi:NMD protein affecting ribosome stability and mRNA decay